MASSSEAVSATARMLSGEGLGRSHDRTTTWSNRSRWWRRAVRIPPSGPAPGALSGSTSKPRSRRRSSSPPTTTASTPKALVRASATPTTRGRPPTTRRALSLPIRLLAPPASTAPPVRVSGRAFMKPAQPGPSKGGSTSGQSGSSWRRKSSQRSSSSVSPISRAVRASPARARRNPRLVGCDHRT